LFFFRPVWFGTKAVEEPDMAMASDGIAILLPLGVAVTMTFSTVVIQALFLVPIVHFVRFELRFGRAGVRFWRDVGIITGATLLALAAHVAAITMWALVFRFFGEFSQLARAVYHSGMNYTTLGDSDKVMSLVEIIGSSGGSQRHADVWRVNDDAVCHCSATNPDETWGFEQTRG
jgi:hypothetical protein